MNRGKLHRTPKRDDSDIIESQALNCIRIVPYMYLILHVYMQSAKTFPALLAAMLVYVPGDTLKIIVVTALAPVLRRTLAKAVPNL